jgi:integration host factor subunit beta
MVENKLTRSVAESIIILFSDESFNVLANGNRVEIRGLCSFYVKKYKPYTRRNPKTGKPKKVKPKKLPFFKFRKELKKRVNY